MIGLRQMQIASQTPRKAPTQASRLRHTDLRDLRTDAEICLSAGKLSVGGDSSVGCTGASDLEPGSTALFLGVERFDPRKLFTEVLQPLSHRGKLLRLFMLDGELNGQFFGFDSLGPLFGRCVSSRQRVEEQW